MERRILTFTANEQILIKTSGIEYYASNIVEYIEAHFELGDNWAGYDSVRAVWYNDYATISTVLDSNGVCRVPYEVLTRTGIVKVNLVGSIADGDVLTDRLTTYPIHAVCVDKAARVTGDNARPVTPSEYEQFVATVRADADRAETSAESASGSAESAEASATAAAQSASDAQTSAQNASESATSAESAKDEAIDAKEDAESARDEIRSMRAEATTLSAGSDATASYSDGLLSLGIPRGDKGEKGDKGDTGATPNLTIGTVETLPPTGTSEVTITGTAENPVLNFKLVKGDTGEVTMAQLEVVDSEVQNIRVGADNVTYTSAGEAVRTQISDLKTDLFHVNGKSIYNSASLGSSGVVGQQWNLYHTVNIPSGTILKFCIEKYTGSLFTSARILAHKEDDTYTVLSPTIKSVGGYSVYTTTEDYVSLQIQIMRSAVENNVSTSYYVEIYEGENLRTSFRDVVADIPKASVEITDDVLFYNAGYYFSTDGKTIESAGNTSWCVSDYIPIGLGITVTGNCASAYRPQIVEYDANRTFIGMQKLGASGSITKTYTPDNGVAFVRLQSTRTLNMFASGTQLVIEPIPRIYHVEKDGSGDFTKLTDAIKEATRRMDAVVYVGAGTWDLIDEFGSEYIETVSFTQRGLYLKNRVHVICSSDSIITCNYTGSRSDTITWLSAFNAGKYGFTLENATIESSKCRYSVHDERDQDADEYNNYYINCRMKHDNTDGGYNQCIGGGLGLNGNIVIDGCTFENPARSNYQIVYYHNSAGSGKNHVEVKDSFFKGTNTLGFQWYGSSTKISTLFAHGNSLGSAIQHTGASGATIQNTEVVSFNNEIRE